MAVASTAQHDRQATQQQQTQRNTFSSSSQALAPHPIFASSSLSVPLGGGYWATSAGGWVVALSLLIAVRQGRAHADAARLDVRALQARQQESRVQVRQAGRQASS